MDRREASRQLCKMQGEVAGRMGLETQCVCDHAVREPGEVPDAVIEEMWRRLTHPFRNRGDRDLCKKCSKLILDRLGDEDLIEVVRKMGLGEVEQQPAGTLCSICGKLQYETPSGVTCPEGHGGAPPSGELPKEER